MLSCEGTALGGAVRLHAAEGPLVVAEGIETALSLASGLLRIPSTVWATLSAAGLAGLRLPYGTPHRLIIVNGRRNLPNLGRAKFPTLQLVISR